jgi:hypothetical protein
LYKTIQALTSPALEEANSLRLNLFQELVSGPFHLLQFFSGISKKIHAHATELRLVVGRTLQKRQVTLFEDEEEVSVAARNRLPPGQGTEKPNLIYFRMLLG